MHMKNAPIKILLILWTVALGRILKDRMRKCLMITGQFISVASDELKK